MSNQSTILESFIEIDKNSDFPIQNLPYGIFQLLGDDNPRVGVAIGSYILDLAILEEKGVFGNRESKFVFNRRYLNNFMKQGKKFWDEIREKIQYLLNKDTPDLRDNEALKSQVLIPMEKCELLLPIKTTDYTDFYASKDHASNVGTMFRGPENALTDNWLHMPIGYHGRASSIILSGENIKRPSGQLRPPGSDRPYFGPSKRLDYEFEMGVYVGGWKYIK